LLGGGLIGNVRDKLVYLLGELMIEEPAVPEPTVTQPGGSNSYRDLLGRGSRGCGSNAGRLHEESLVRVEHFLRHEAKLEALVST
jgi:hypothetical protein